MQQLLYVYFYIYTIRLEKQVAADSKEAKQCQAQTSQATDTELNSG